jgi:hypothetical protein
MRNFRLTLTTLFAPAVLLAQTVATTNVNNYAATVTGKSLTTRNNTNPIETPESARKQVVSTLNLMRGFSISVEEASNTNDDNTETNNNAQNTTFGEYVSKMETVLKNRIRKMEMSAQSDPNDISKNYRALNILHSAECLADRNDGNFVRQQDIDGQEVVAFPVETLRNNVRYGYVENYKDGYALIKKDQVFGFLNYCGDEVIACQYEAADRFNNGRALVKKVNWFFIDAKGVESEPLKNVVEAQALKFGISLVKLTNGKMAFITNRYDVSKNLSSPEYDEITPMNGLDEFRVRIGNKYGVVDINGNIKLTPQYESIEMTNENNIYRVTQNGKIGLVDNNWKVRATPSFTSLTTFDNFGIAVAQEGNLYRLISCKTFKMSDLYKNITFFNKKGLAQIQKDNGKFGLINTDLAVVVAPIYTTIGEFNDFGLAPACIEDKQCGFINMRGKEVITPIYEAVESFTRHGLVVVHELTKECNKNKTCRTDVVYNKYGQVIIAKANETEVNTMKIRYDVLDTLHSDKYIAVRKTVDEVSKGFQLIESGSFKLLNNQPLEAITPYDVNGMFRVRVSNLWGLMDTAGHIVVEPAYAEIRKTFEGVYPIKNDQEKYGFMDKKGKIVIPFEYDDVKSFRNGYCIVAKGKEKWGLINKYNAKIVPCVFKSVAVKEGQYEMTDSKDAVYMINDKGDCLQNCQKFEDIRKKANQ